MELTINNQLVLRTSFMPKGSNKEVTKYAYKAFSKNRQGEPDANWRFFEGEMEKDEYLRKFRDTICTTLVIELSANADWDIYGIGYDMWGVMTLKNNQTQDIIHVEFDYIEHGLMAAYLIAKHINPECF